MCKAQQGCSVFFALRPAQVAVSASLCLVLAPRALWTPSAMWRNAAYPDVPVASSDQIPVLIG